MTHTCTRKQKKGARLCTGPFQERKHPLAQKSTILTIFSSRIIDHQPVRATKIAGHTQENRKMVHGYEQGPSRNRKHPHTKKQHNTHLLQQQDHWPSTRAHHQVSRTHIRKQKRGARLWTGASSNRKHTETAQYLLASAAGSLTINPCALPKNKTHTRKQKMGARLWMGPFKQQEVPACTETHNTYLLHQQDYCPSTHAHHQISMTHTRQQKKVHV